MPKFSWWKELKNRERLEWFIIFFASIILLIIIVASLFNESRDLTEVFTFFGGIAALVLGAATATKIAGNNNNKKD